MQLFFKAFQAFNRTQSRNVSRHVHFKSLNVESPAGSLSQGPKVRKIGFSLSGYHGVEVRAVLLILLFLEKAINDSPRN